MLSTGPAIPLTGMMEVILIAVPVDVATTGTSVALKLRVTAGDGVGVAIGVGVAVGPGVGVGWLPGWFLDGLPGTGTELGPPGTGTDPGAPGTGTESAAVRALPWSWAGSVAVGPTVLRSADWQAVNTTRARLKATWRRAAFRIDSSSVQTSR
jgi:hypothetical protein